MPELPEVETMRRGVLHVQGSSLDEIEFVKTRFRPIQVTPCAASFSRRARGHCIVEIARLGKRILLRLENAETIVIEPRMTGLLLVSEPPDQEHLRVCFRLRGGAVQQLLFWDRRGLGTVRLMSLGEMQQQLGPDRIGPDALEITETQLRDRLSKSGRAIKVAMLDQRAIAGVGNLYASELLYRAHVHPQKRCHALRKTQWAAIHEAMVEVLSEAIRYEGSTLSDGTYRNALNQQGSYQNHHRVYGRASEPCPACKTRVIRIVQAQRSTFFCPQCQRK